MTFLNFFLIVMIFDWNDFLASGFVPSVVRLPPLAPPREPAPLAVCWRVLGQILGVRPLRAPSSDPRRYLELSDFVVLNSY